MAAVLTKRRILLSLWWASLVPGYVIAVYSGFFICGFATSAFGRDFDDPSYVAPVFFGEVVWFFFIAITCAVLAPAQRGRVALLAGIVSMVLLTLGNYQDRSNFILDSEAMREVRDDFAAILGACGLGSILAYFVIRFFKMAYQRRLRLDAERALSTTSA